MKVFETGNAGDPGNVEASSEVTGYLHKDYALALREFGTPTRLSSCRAWLLKRPIPNSDYSDAMGLYPLFCCEKWKQLAEDVQSLQGHLVSLVLVADPLGDCSVADLQATFQLVSAFKQHCVINFEKVLNVSKHHRYYARRARKLISIELAQTPAAFSEEFATLYNVLVDRHGLRGLKAFSRNSLALQLRVPGAVLFRAVHQGLAVGAQIWMVRNDVAYSHLMAMSAQGYEMGASYGLCEAAIEYFRGRLRWLDLGSIPGGTDRDDDGLAMFKNGWSNTLRTAFLCGVRLREGEYSRLCSTSKVRYFPGYRDGELI